MPCEFRQLVHESICLSSVEFAAWMFVQSAPPEFSKKGLIWFIVIIPATNPTRKITIKSILEKLQKPLDFERLLGSGFFSLGIHSPKSIFGLVLPLESKTTLDSFTESIRL